MLALPFMELAAFIAVAVAFGLLWALALMAAGSLAGVMVLRHAGGNQIARIRVAMGDGGFTALQADGPGTAHPVCRDSAAHSGVYNRRPRRFCCCWRRCAGRSPR